MDCFFDSRDRWRVVARAADRDRVCAKDVIRIVVAGLAGREGYVRELSFRVLPGSKTGSRSYPRAIESELGRQNRMIDFIVDILMKPFFSEKLQVLKYCDQKSTAKRLLASPSPPRAKKGLSLLFELAVSYPYRVQEVINTITAFLRRSFPQEKPVSPQQKEVLELGIRSLAAIPRLDPNGFAYDLDIHQIRIEDMNLTRTNFKSFSLWGCQFFNVILAHSSFEEADLGGTVFDNCSLEYADFQGAKLCGSPEDNNRPTRLRNTKLWRANLKDADVAFCELQNCESVDLPSIQHRIAEGKVKIV